MAYIHFGERRLIVSIVYFGPVDAGSSSNVRQLHRLQAGHDKDELEKQPVLDGDAWRFSYRPSEVVGLTEFDLEVSVVSLSSTAKADPARDDLVAGVDGVVFVADARAARVEDNLAALLDLEHRLAREGTDLGSLPVVVQVNHLDAGNARPVARVVEDLNPFGFPVIGAIARQGQGVVETHDAVFSATMARLRDNLAQGYGRVTLTSLSQAARAADDDTILSHIASLGGVRTASAGQAGSQPAAEIHLRPAELAESRPIHLVRSELRGHRIRSEVIVRRVDGTSRKLAFVLEPGGENDAAPQTPAPFEDEPPLLLRAAEGRPEDWSGITYGVIGVGGGVLIGLLLPLLFG